MIPLDTKIKELLQQVEERLKAIFGGKLSKIILYGSHARGDYDRYSDIDIIALVDAPYPEKVDKQILRLNVDLSIQYDVDLSIVTINKREFDSNVDIIPLYKNVEREGINIYAA